MRRTYQGRQLDAQDELSAITKRQLIHVVRPCADSRDLRPRRDWKFIGAVCAGVMSALIFVGLLVRAL